MATWVVQSNKVSSYLVLDLVNALRRLNEPFVDVGIDAETGLLTKVDPSLGQDLIPYGSTYLSKVAQEHGWKHLFFDERTFNVAAWLKNHPRMLNVDSSIGSLSTLKGIVSWTNTVDKWFIRPLNDLKEFHGHVIDSKEFLKWVERLEVGDCELTTQTMACLSFPKDIQMEWRYFIVGGRIITGSSYRFKGQPYRRRELDQAVIKEAQTLADMWLPHPCCVMDIALYNDVPYVVEFNTLNASGFYDHDVDLLVQEVSNYARASVKP